MDLQRYIGKWIEDQPRRSYPVLVFRGSKNQLWIVVNEIERITTCKCQKICRATTGHS